MHMNTTTKQQTTPSDMVALEQNMKIEAAGLNKILADEFVLHAMLLQYHWNVTGINFIELHRFYAEQYQQVERMMKSLAERVRALGHLAEGRLSECLKHTHLNEEAFPVQHLQQLNNLIKSHETVIQHLQRMKRSLDRTYRMYGTGDFLEDLVAEHESMILLIRCYL
ncbi:starvation-inducible DNA-binding protein [Chitinophaga costaii]|uniref:Starvation-inducible DNA-binding protein n=2 Tax=Chitinophaga costaii TaxID=1335309 RepID=A0A1C4FPW8_9BACT|nr:starvation-inducible DNA-binding protein [Chitinophaga costaii]